MQPNRRFGKALEAVAAAAAGIYGVSGQREENPDFMLIIRNAQLEAMRLGLLVRTLAEAHPQQWASLGKQAFRQRVLDAFAEAAEHGLTSDDHQKRYASLCLTQGSAFPHELDWASAILGWDESAEARLAAMEQHLVQARIAALLKGDVDA